MCNPTPRAPASTAPANSALSPSSAHPRALSEQWHEQAHRKLSDADDEFQTRATGEQGHEQAHRNLSDADDEFHAAEKLAREDAPSNRRVDVACFGAASVSPRTGAPRGPLTFSTVAQFSPSQASSGSSGMRRSHSPPSILRVSSGATSPAGGAFERSFTVRLPPFVSVFSFPPPLPAPLLLRSETRKVGA